MRENKALVCIDNTKHLHVKLICRHQRTISLTIIYSLQFCPSTFLLSSSSCPVLKSSNCASTMSSRIESPSPEDPLVNILRPGQTRPVLLDLGQPEIIRQISATLQLEGYIILKSAVKAHVQDPTNSDKFIKNPVRRSTNSDRHMLI